MPLLLISCVVYNALLLLLLTFCSSFAVYWSEMSTSSIDDFPAVQVMNCLSVNLVVL